MSIDTTTESDISVTQLLNGIVTDAQNLGLQHLELFRSEMLTEFHKTMEALVSMAVGFAVIQIAGLLLGQMFAYLLLQLAPGLQIWQCYAIVSCIVAGCGAIPLVAGFSRLKAMRPVPHVVSTVHEGR